MNLQKIQFLNLGQSLNFNQKTITYKIQNSNISNMASMQQDPVFKKMYDRSFILKKYEDLDVPVVKKYPSIKNHAMTTFFLSTFVHLVIYPFDTIKTRLIASNKITDIAKFQLNKTKNETAYLGLFRGYFSVLIGNAVYLAIGREDFIKGAVIQGLLKTWIDMMKISKQMANKNADLQIMRKTFGIASVTAILRDLLYRGSFMLIFKKLNEQNQEGSKFDKGSKINNMFIGTLIATMISQPLQVCFIKIASQRQLKYTNLFKTPIQIIKEQGFGKFAASGLWPRLVYNLLSTSLMFNFYDTVLEASLQAI